MISSILIAISFGALGFIGGFFYGTYRAFKDSEEYKALEKEIKEYEEMTKDMDVLLAMLKKYGDK